MLNNKDHLCYLRQFNPPVNSLCDGRESRQDFIRAQSGSVLIYMGNGHNFINTAPVQEGLEPFFNRSRPANKRILEHFANCISLMVTPNTTHILNRGWEQYLVSPNHPQSPNLQRG